MHPATCLPLWRGVPSGGAEINRYHLPRGLVVGISTCVAHYDEDAFADAKSFILERWLEGGTEAEQLYKMNEMYLLVVFFANLNLVFGG